nr:hypothetical protein [Bacillota bacterium]
MGAHHEIRKSMRFVKRTASYLLLFTLLFQVFSVAPAFAEEAPSLPQASTVTVEIPDNEKQFFDLFRDIKNIIMQF